MTADQILAEIREANLSYLMLAQSLIRVDTEQARIGKTPMERIYRIAKPALLTDLLEQAGRHAPAQNHG